MWGALRGCAESAQPGALKRPRARRTLGRVAGLDDAWGGSLRMSLTFKERGRLLPSVRNLVVELCSEYLDSNERTQQLVLAVQELVENLVKYSDGGRSVLEFELLMLDARPCARIRTSNHASAARLGDARAMLDRIIAAPDSVELMHALVASSGDREGSRLGLARLRAEVGLELSYDVENDRLSIEARGAVQARGRR